MLKSQYLNTGKVRFAYRDFPRDEKGWGLVSAHAARCAGEQGQYWPMHDRLFEEAGRLGTGVIIRIAKDLRLKTDLFGTCMDSQKHVESIMADKEVGERLGAAGVSRHAGLPNRQDGRRSLLGPGKDTGSRLIRSLPGSDRPVAEEILSVSLGDVEHALERDPRPVFLILGH